MICPICGKLFSEPPALSRTDNKTLICPECGVREALQAASIPPKQIEEIMATIQRKEASK